MSEFESLLSVFFLREKNLGKIIIIKIKQKGLKLCFFLCVQVSRSFGYGAVLERCCYEGASSFSSVLDEVLEAA